MKGRFTFFSLLCLLLTTYVFNGFGEGTKELMPDQTKPTRILLDPGSGRDPFALFSSYITKPNYRLMIHIEDPANEKIFFGTGQQRSGGNNTIETKINWRIHKPDGSVESNGQTPIYNNPPTVPSDQGYIESYEAAVAGPNIIDPAGYDAIICSPTVAGDYFITFEATATRTFDYLDITVINTSNTPPTAIPGRVYAKCWQIRNPDYTNPTPPPFSLYYTFSGKMYIYSNDGIVTRFDPNNFEGRDFSITSNESGCLQVGGTVNAQQARRSQTGPSPKNYPQFKIFLNNPDILVYPDGVIGQLVDGSVVATPNCNGTIDFTFETTPANALGTVEITLDLSTIIPQPVPPYANRILIVNNVPGGLYTINWDGKDANGVIVANGSTFPFALRYTKGLTHLPLWDVENNLNGFKVNLVRPVLIPPLPEPAFYWDDQLVSGSNPPPATINVNPPGCTDPTGCHGWGDDPWPSPYNNGSWGDVKTINTWWYLVSNSTQPVTIKYIHNPGVLVPVTPPTDVCQGATVTFTIQDDPHSAEYNWVWDGGTQTTTLPTITITFPAGATPGASHVYVNGWNLDCPNGPVLDIPFTMHALPNATLTGPDPVCRNSTQTYTTTAGMVNYIWTVTGGNITAGGTSTSGSVTVDWNTAGPGNITVSFADPFGCGTPTPASKSIPINPLPNPTITQQSTSVCLNIPVTYTTESGMSGYSWQALPDGTITPTANPYEISVSWPTTGAKTVTVTYTDGNGCSPATPKVFNVTVNPLPLPSFTGGSNSVCLNVPGQVYTTQPGMSNYVWTVTGGTITAGGTTTSNSVTVTWNTLGGQSVSVNYTNPATQCTAVSPTVFNVTVKSLPVPTISGPLTACVNTPGPQFITEPGMSGYSWTVNGGTYTYGATNDIINVTWTSTGIRTVTVDYTAPNGCNASSPTVYQVNVSPLPTVSISGTSSICTGIPTVYNTDPGMSGYTWVVSAGGTINSGAGTDAINVTWNTPGANSVSINYTSPLGCRALNPSTVNVTVNQSTPPTIQSSVNPVCESYTSVYTTQAGNSAYSWTLSPGGTITAGGGPANNTVTIRWNVATPQFVRVNFANTFGCVAPTPTEYNVTVNPLPNTSITGNLTVCQDFPTLYQYQTAVIEAAPATYSWLITGASGTITPNLTSNPININWNAPGTATITVNAMSGLGCPNTGSANITINPKPTVSLTTCNDQITSRSGRRFQLKGGNPGYPLTGSPLQGEYLATPVTTALQADINGNYYFNPSLVPGINSVTYSITYRYTNQYVCPNTTTPVNITVHGPNPSCGANMTDPRDGKVYTTSVLGGRCWMTQNLNYNRNLGVTPITTQQTDNCVVEKYCPPSDPTCSTFGAYYQWNELVQYNNTDVPYQGVCPPGWHVPTEADWQTLIDNLDPAFTAPAANALVGAELKDPSKSFKARLEGINYLNSNIWNFTSGLTASMYWTSTPDGTDRAIARGLNNPYNSSISRYSSNHANAFPVRCVKD